MLFIVCIIYQSYYYFFFFELDDQKKKKDDRGKNNLYDRRPLIAGSQQPVGRHRSRSMLDDPRLLQRASRSRSIKPFLTEISLRPAMLLVGNNLSYGCSCPCPVRPGLTANSISPFFFSYGPVFVTRKIPYKVCVLTAAIVPVIYGNTGVNEPSRPRFIIFGSQNVHNSRCGSTRGLVDDNGAGRSKNDNGGVGSANSRTRRPDDNDNNNDNRI